MYKRILLTGFVLLFAVTLVKADGWDWVNPSFEEGSGGDATAWVPFGNPARTDTEVGSGDWSMSATDGGTAGWHNVTQTMDNLTLHDGTTVTASMYYKGQWEHWPGPEGMRIHIYLYSGDDLVANQYKYYSSAADWTYGEITAVVPSGETVTKAKILLTYYGDGDSNGTVYWDDVGLDIRRNWVNPSFEEGSGASATGWVPFGDPARTDTEARSGDWSMSATDDSTAGWHNVTQTMENLNLDDDITVTASMYYKGQWEHWPGPEGMRIHIYLYSGDDLVANQYKYYSSAANWTYGKITAVVPSSETVTKAKILLAYYGDGDSNGTVYWDDVGLDIARTGTIDVNLADVDFSFLGIGWNINNHSIVPQYWSQFEDLLDDMQMHYARLIMHMEYWQPDEGTFTPTSGYMNRTYDFLDYCEDNNIIVQFHNWWTGGRFDGGNWPNHYWWLANCCHVDPTNSHNKWAKDGTGPETDYPYSTDKFAESIRYILDYMVNTEDYTCVKYAGIWNEPDGSWAFNPRDMDGNGYPDFVYPDDTYVLYRKLHECLDACDLDIKVVGCDITADSSSDPMDDIGDALSAWDGGQRVDYYMDAISFHSYVDSYDDLCYRAREQIRTHNYDDVQEKLLVGEIGIYGGPDPDTLQLMVNNSLDCAKKIIGYAKEGAYAIARWWYHNNGESDGWAAAIDFGRVKVPQNFNPMKLYCRSLPKDSVNRYIIGTDVDAETGYLDAVNITYWYQGGHKNTVWVVNDDTISRDVTVTFSNAGGYPSSITFEKKYINMDDLTCPIIDGDNITITKTNQQFKFVDTIPARCLVAYRQL